jgi:hypothetical protein
MADPRDDPLYRLWIDGRPAAHAPPDRQHAAVLEALLDKADAEPPKRWT